MIVEIDINGCICEEARIGPCDTLGMAGEEEEDNKNASSVFTLWL